MSGAGRGGPGRGGAAAASAPGRGDGTGRGPARPSSLLFSLALFPANFFRSLCLTRPGPARCCRAPRGAEVRGGRPRRPPARSRAGRRAVPPGEAGPSRGSRQACRVPSHAGFRPRSQPSPGRRPRPARRSATRRYRPRPAGCGPLGAAASPKRGALALGTGHLVWVCVGRGFVGFFSFFFLVCFLPFFFFFFLPSQMFLFKAFENWLLFIAGPGSPLKE